MFNWVIWKKQLFPLDTSCSVWPEENYVPCSLRAAIVCLVDLKDKLIFPDPREDLSVIEEATKISFNNIDNNEGWLAEYYVEAGEENKVHR